METELIEHQTMSAIVNNVNVAKDEVKQAFALLLSAKNRLHAVIGRDSHHDSVFPRDINDYSISKDGDYPEKSFEHITRNAWQYILKQTGLTGFMTAKRKDELYNQIESGNVPELTEKNIYETLQGLSGNINNYLIEFVKEVFDWLRPQYSQLKTNKKFSVGEKVIIGWAVEHGYSAKYRFQYRAEDKFTNLDNAFHLLDGRGIPQNPDNFVTRCRAAMENNAETYEDDYFICKMYGNGNMHVSFKRLDLLKELNRIGGGEDLPGKEYERPVRTHTNHDAGDKVLATMGLM